MFPFDKTVVVFHVEHDHSLYFVFYVGRVIGFCGEVVYRFVLVIEEREKE